MPDTVEIVANQMVVLDENVVATVGMGFNKGK